MDIKKEREAFERHASKFFTDSKEAFKTNGDQYLYDEVIWMWDCWIERAKAQAVPEGFVLVEKELPESIAETMALERVNKPFGETDPVWVEITEKVYKERLVSKKWELWRDYKDMIEAQEPAND